MSDLERTWKCSYALSVGDEITFDGVPGKHPHRLGVSIWCPERADDDGTKGVELDVMLYREKVEELAAFLGNVLSEWDGADEAEGPEVGS